MSSIQRPISAAAHARAQRQSAAVAPAGGPAGQAAAAAKERSLRSDPTLARSFRGHHGAVLSVAYSPVLVRAGDTKLPGYAPTAADGSGGEVEIGGTVSSRARAHKAANSFVQQLASGGADHVVMLWHLRPQLRAFRFLGHAGAVNAVQFSSDGSLLASASDDQTVRVWTPSAEGRSVVLRGHMKRVRSLAWASDNQWLLSSSDDQQCKLWDVHSGVAHSHFHGHTQSVSSCTFSPDMRLVATGSADRTVKLYDLNTQSCIQTFYQNTGEVTCVKFHPFGNVLATGCADNSIKLWDIRNNQLLQHYSAHDLSVSAIDFHPSGNYLLSSSLDSSIRLWDLRQGHQLYTIHGHPSPVHSCAFNADGSAFVTGGGDQRVITWNTNLDQTDATTRRSVAGGGTDFGAPLPRVGVADEQTVPSGGTTKRGAMLASQVPRPVHGGSTGQMLRNSVEAGRRDAYYAAHGLTSGPTTSGRMAPPQPSGPLPPTAMAPVPARSPSPHSAGLDGSQRRRRGPPTYTFRTGEHAGQVIGGGHLYVEDASAPSAPPAEGEGCCDYKHSHISSSTGEVHSYLDVHDPALVAESAERAAAHAARYPGGPPGIESQPLEEQMRGFAIPGLTSLTDTGRASTRAGIPGPSPQPPEVAAEDQQQPDTARSQLSVGVPSFAAASAGVQGHLVRASVSRRAGSGGAAAAAGAPRPKDELVYSFQSDRFVSASAHPNQAKTSEAAALKNTPGVDIFAIPPADHIQRLPEQLAHTLKYMTTQMEQITRALNVFEYRMNVYEAKVDRLDQQQARWSAADGF